MCLVCGRIWCCPECPAYDDGQWERENVWNEDEVMERYGFKRSGNEVEKDHERGGNVAP